jgi:general secretion pathway protein F
MTRFRYEARAMGGAGVSGVIDAEDRQAALSALTRRGLFPSALEDCPETGRAAARNLPPPAAPAPASLPARGAAPGREAASGGRVRKKDVTAFTREMATLLAATIPIPAALEGIGGEEENPALQRVILDLLTKVRTGTSLSAAMQSHPLVFPPFYTSMVQVGEEAGALDRVLGDLADLLEGEDETRGEVLGAIAYPVFVLVLGAITTFVLLAFVLPRLFDMLAGMVDVLPLPTRVLLWLSNLFKEHWLPLLLGAAAVGASLRWWVRSPAGALLADGLKLRIPLIGSVFRSSALARFARTLGVLLRSGVSLLPALEIVRNTVGNRVVARSLVAVAEETRGGDSLAAPLRKTGLFPPTVVQMVAVGEETGKLDEMLLRIAKIEERHLRGRSRTLISLLAPALILVVGALVGFIVIALLLPIFRMSQVIQ